MNLPAIPNAYYRWVIVASGGLLGCIAMAVGSIDWGNLSDRFGPRMVVLAGSVLLPLAWP